MQNLASILVAKPNAKAEHAFPCGCRFVMTFAEITDKVDPSGDFIIRPQVSRNDWIKWAECEWDDIQHTDTLNIHEARTEADTRHICPFALETCRRLILLYSNPGEIVFDPFAGVASMGYTALGGEAPKSKKRIFDQRRFYGCELKDEYYAAAINNCGRAIKSFRLQQKDLFSEAVSEPVLA